MKILISILIALGMTLGLTATAATAASGIEIRMKPIIVHQSDVYGIYHSIEVAWNYGWPDRDSNPRHAWAAPRFIKVTANRHGTHEECGLWDTNNGTWWRITIYHPFTGRTWHTAWIKVPCDRDTVAERTISLFTSGRWPYSGGMYAKFYPRITAEWHDEKGPAVRDSWGKIGPKFFWRP